ncbi:helix-hairpin-helix domain-containing protein [Flavobacterium sp. PL002]|uniref:ComEA family DNA-binding protein n=1 Tax=Flavobacterium sp. PL002 TaxID=1897058 RepID=UPI001787C8DB|nr:helix-hairpin-helix domain-containing protein [Flavobacterium sp. PL002]MBE0391470.1 hypothetical protein [Flavobacterium sp. PL002]
MNFKKITNYFKYSKEQSKAVLLLFGIIITSQMIYFFVDFDSQEENDPEEQQWLSLQHGIDSLKIQKDSLAYKVYPYNPNFISDYKGYKLGMSIAEIDRLHDFRNKNKYVNSAAEFQSVTKVSDSLLQTMSSNFKFPDWVTNKKSTTKYVNYTTKAFAKKEKVQSDINSATQEDLIKVYGVGAAFSERILKYKATLGSFVSMDQIEDVWGLSPEAVQGVKDNFKIGTTTNLNKLDINNASLKEISRFPYFNYKQATSIITYRSMNGDFVNIEDLIKIKGFPVDKAKIIALYLDFD